MSHDACDDEAPRRFLVGQAPIRPPGLWEYECLALPAALEWLAQDGVVCYVRQPQTLWLLRELVQRTTGHPLCLAMADPFMPLPHLWFADEALVVTLDGWDHPGLLEAQTPQTLTIWLDEEHYTFGLLRRLA